VKISLAFIFAITDLLTNRRNARLITRMLYSVEHAVAVPAGRLTKQRKVTSGTRTVQRTASKVRPIKLRSTVSQQQLAANNKPASACSILIEVGTQCTFASLSNLKKSQTRVNECD